MNPPFRLPDFLERLVLGRLVKSLEELNLEIREHNLRNGLQNTHPNLGVRYRKHLSPSGSGTLLALQFARAFTPLTAFLADLRGEPAPYSCFTGGQSCWKQTYIRLWALVLLPISTSQRKWEEGCAETQSDLARANTALCPGLKARAKVKVRRLLASTRRTRGERPSASGAFEKLPLVVRAVKTITLHHQCAPRRRWVERCQPSLFMTSTHRG